MYFLSLSFFVKLWLLVSVGICILIIMFHEVLIFIIYHLEIKVYRSTRFSYLEPVTQNCKSLSKYLKGKKACTWVQVKKLGLIWIINPRMLLRSKPNLGIDLPYFSFYCKCCSFRIILLYIVSFLIFYPKMNKPYPYILTSF